MPISPCPSDLPAALSGRRVELRTANAGRISWYQSEPVETRPGGVPLLLVHSVNAAASAYEMRPLYEHYRLERPVYALDLPGFGFSAREDRCYTPRLMTDALHALVAEIRRERGDVPIDAIALSLSSEFLARAAVEAPDGFRSIALVSPTGFSGARLLEGPAQTHFGKPGVLAVLRALRLRRAVFALLTRRGVIRYFLGRTYGSPAIDAGLLDYDHASTRPAGAEFAPLHFLAAFLFSRDSGTLYRALTQPVWLAHGVRGDFARYRALGELADRGNWTVQVFATGALPHFEVPALFIARYEAWRAR